jgi:hypothetical protein
VGKRERPDLAAIYRRATASSEGPLEVYDSGDGYVARYWVERPAGRNWVIFAHCAREEDAVFFATARADVLVLLLEIGQLEDALEAVHDGLRPDNWLPGPVMAQVMRALGKGQGT